MQSPAIKKLIDIFSKFPTIGPKTAARFVFYLLEIPKEEVKELISTIAEVRNAVKICSVCFNHFQGEGKVCDICRDQRRDKSLLCIIEKETDLMAIEKTRKYKGLYFILGGTVSSLKKSDIEKLRTKELEELVKNETVKEIILATNSTTEGEATALYLVRLLKDSGKKITKLGRGLPLGGELEYADEETLSSAFEGRK